MGRENGRNIGIPPPIHDLWPGILTQDDISKKVASHNANRGWPGYNSISRKDARALFPFGTEAEDTIPTSNPNGQYWFTTENILALQKEYIRNAQIQPYFSESIKLDDLPIRDKKAGETFQNAQVWLFYSYKQRNPVIQTLYEINPEIIKTLEEHYFQGKSRKTIKQDGKLTPAQIDRYIKLGLHALEFSSSTLNPALSQMYENWLYPLINNWKGIKDRLRNIPNELQEPAKQIIAGQPVEIVAKNHNISSGRLWKLMQFLVYEAEPYKPFATAFKQDEIENLLESNNEYNKMPHVDLLKKFIKHKINGGNVKTFLQSENISDGTVITVILIQFLKDVVSEFDLDSLPVEIQGLLATKDHPFNSKEGRKAETWVLLNDCHEELIRRMQERKRSFTPNQEDFLTLCQLKLKNNTPLTIEESILLNAILGRFSPRAEKKNDRTNWATSIIENDQFAILDDSQKEILILLSQSIGIAKIAASLNTETENIYRIIGKIQKKLNLSRKT